MRKFLWPQLVVNLSIPGSIWRGTAYFVQNNPTWRYSTNFERVAMPNAGDPFLAPKQKLGNTKWFTFFHFLQTGMVFENVNAFSWIFNAISGEKSCLISKPFLTCLLDVRTLKFFPPAESLSVNSNFPRASRMQGGNKSNEQAVKNNRNTVDEK